VRLRQFLNVVDAGADRIEIGLRRSDLEHVQDNLRILGIVLVPAVVQSFPRTGQRNRGHQPECDAGFEQPEGQRSVVIARRLEAGDDWLAKAMQQVDEAIMLSLRVRHDEASSSHLARELNQYVVA
jgi:hypothetical protein